MSHLMSFVVGLGADLWIPYALALVAAGLLPIKKRWAYRVVFLLLALLWSWLTVAAMGSHSLFWVLLAVIEAGFFLFFGAITGWLELRVRKGLWAVVGTSFIAYTLLVFPLLSRVFGVPTEYVDSSFGAPLPVILFTCGVLSFAVQSRAVLVFMVPLLWALLGGPESSLAERVGLQAALLVGTFFLVSPSELRQASGDGGPAPGAAYRIAYRRRAYFGYGLWILILTTVLLFFTSPKVVPTEITINLALLSALGIVLWLTFLAWQSFWYRSVAWWLAQVGGRLWIAAQCAWRWGILVLAAAALWAYLIKPGEPKPQGDQKPSVTAPSRNGTGAAPLPNAPPGQTQGKQTAANAAKTAAEARKEELRQWPFRFFMMTLFLWLAYHAFRGRKRLVIGTFSGYGDESLEKGLAAGLGMRLQSELARIADVYKVIDEMSPSPGRSIIEVTPGVLEVGEILKDASAITFGVLKIPANFFAGLVGNIVSGPRLTGALHKVEDQFVLTAEISGGGFSSNWRVDYGDFSEEEMRLSPGAAIQKLIEQLAFRVATDLVSVGSPRWRAVRCYTDGLRSYREAQRQQRNRKFRLRDSERCLIRALNDDQRFMQCHYNLGVVYRQLGENSSAQAAFRRALGEDPDNFDACYALAEVLAVGNKEYREGVWFCEAAISINPDDPRAWALEAFSRLELHKELYQAKMKAQSSQGVASPSSPDQVFPPATDPSWEEVRGLSEIAAALAWQALCHQALFGKPSTWQREKAAAFTCTRNLAVVLTRCGRFPESRQAFRQAAWLAPHDPNLRLYEGRTLFWNRAEEDAAKALEGVFADGMGSVDQGLLWSILAQVQARSGPAEDRHERMRIAHRRFLDIAAGANSKQLTELIELGLEPTKPAFQEECS